MLDALRRFLIETLEWAHATWLVEAALLLSVAIAAVVTYYIIKWVLYGIEWLVAWTPAKWDDILLNRRMLKSVAQMAPALVVNYMLPTFFQSDTTAHRWIKILTALYILVTTVYIVTILIRNFFELMEQTPKLRRYAIKGVFDMLRLVAVCIGIIVGVSILFHKEPAAILTAIGASAAVLMLVFKDTIMGLVASVQFSANNMLRKGDWIICDSHDINGEVIQVSLTTIKVKNWDNSISTIPPYTLVSDSFRNYQAMRRDSGRRVDRSILLDTTTIRFLEREELARLEKMGFLEGLDISQAGAMVNSHLLRRYLDHYLKNDDRVVHSMLTMVRQMEMTPTGLPLQLYFFTHEVKWDRFEQVQSDIFDHVYAIINLFGLRIYQAPTGRISGRG